MSKKTFLSAVLISSLCISPLFASSHVKDVEIVDFNKAASHSMVGFNSCKFSVFPLVTEDKDSFSQISFLNCTIDKLEPSYFMNNTTLKRLNLIGTLANFTPFNSGTFCQGCTSLEDLNLKDVKNLTFEQFLSIASSDLLDRISEEKCGLKFSRADSGATLARFTKSSNSEELSIEEIKRYISMYRIAKASAQSAPASGGIFASIWSLFGGAAATK